MRKLIVAVLAISALLIGAPTASAHSVVTGSNPADGSEIASGPAQVSISFNEVPQSQFATLNVVGPDGNLWSKGDPRIEGQSIVVDVGELGPVGEYTIAYRVTSADGHPISGTLGFTLTAEGSGTPGAAASAAAEGESDDGSGGGIPVWIFLVAGVLVFAGGLAYALRKPKDK
ncbi:MAG: copper resistance CopC family protein [Rhodococcus fascians]|uniref:copper resistance CopC family protein n=1 Tax=Nocardiaceae TaxID=85025 RepID=UPI000522FDE5|nr:MULTISPECIES: copper resistance CopC family protein [Rhodococcus]OZD12331.1 copper resistance protein CopC [Rhodococcus sp. 06-156-3C]OZD19003.1 copper resistance protein CopC [Rhodococcus sp. 06-156-4C]OZD20958.1 copper resistance protein CopC [Rhodococcus sp. 06-156-4a]OZD29133.1 copper resistance protein CopC [Rhodococcus sp. 06-156-3b]OZD33688.1 copper resistance protein CopC [Rhodococcus sp. 06-156-3]